MINQLIDYQNSTEMKLVNEVQFTSLITVN